MNEGSIEDLVQAIRGLSEQLSGNLEAVFVIDGSPDRSYALLREHLEKGGLQAKLITLARNFGAFSAIRAGLLAATGRFIGVMAADLQEPPALMLRFLSVLQKGTCDVVFGVRESRDDPAVSKLFSQAFWGIYRRLVVRDVPAGGVDVFGLTSEFRDRLLSLNESNTSLLAQLFWLGGRREFVSYARERRKHGKSAWTFKKKLRYLSDSVFAFTDLPVRILFWLGTVALFIAVVMGFITLVAKISGAVPVPGYTGTMLVILFFGALNSLGLGVVGTYAWRAFENTKGRPLAIVQSEERF